MNTKSRAVLIKVSYLLNIEESNEGNIEDMIDKVTTKLSNDHSFELNGESKTIEWVSTSSLELEPMEMNCGKCINCDKWITDREKPDPIMELCYGATVDGVLLCDECLPKNHRWAF